MNKIKDLNNGKYIDLFKTLGFNSEADVNSFNKANLSPLFAFILHIQKSTNLIFLNLSDNEKLEIIECLIKAGADLDYEIPSEHLNFKLDEDLTELSDKTSLLMWAITSTPGNTLARTSHKESKLDIPAILYKYGARLNENDFQIATELVIPEILRYIDPNYYEEFISTIKREYKSEEFDDFIKNNYRLIIVNLEKENNPLLYRKILIEELGIRQLLLIIQYELSHPNGNFNLIKNLIDAFGSELFNNNYLLSNYNFNSPHSQLEDYRKSLNSKEDYERFICTVFGVPSIDKVTAVEIPSKPNIDKSRLHALFQNKDYFRLKMLFSEMDVLDKFDINEMLFNPTKDPFNATKDNGSIIYSLILNRNYDIMQLLQDNGVNINNPLVDGYSILTLLTKEGKLCDYPEIFEKLNLDINKPDSLGRTVYSIAKQNNDTKTLNFLISILLRPYFLEEYSNIQAETSVLSETSATLNNSPSNTDVTLEQLRSFGNKMNTLVRRELFVGSSNVKQDRLRTANWVIGNRRLIRKKYKWQKDRNELLHRDKKAKWDVVYGGNVNFEGMKGSAMLAARALYYKGGNCEEMLKVCMYFICKYILNNKEFLDAIQKNNFSVRCVILDEPLDHAFVEVKYKVDKNNIRSEKVIYIDPWQNVCFTKNELEEIKEKIIQRLIEGTELTVRDNLVRDTVQKPLAKDFANRKDFVNREDAEEFLIDSHIHETMLQNKETIAEFRKSFKLLPIPNVCIANMNNLLSFVNDVEEEFSKLTNKEHTKMPADLKRDIQEAKKEKLKPVAVEKKQLFSYRENKTDTEEDTFLKLWNCKLKEGHEERHESLASSRKKNKKPSKNH